jgi:hypothetical protein
VCLSALPKTHDMEDCFRRVAKAAGSTKGLSLSKRLLDKQAFHRRYLFQKALLDLITS